MSIKRPRREQYASEPAWLNACLRYLDAKYPEREQYRERIAAFERWEAEHDLEAMRARIGELMATTDWTTEEADEFDRLATAWKTRRTNHHTDSRKGIR